MVVASSAICMCILRKMSSEGVSLFLGKPHEFSLGTNTSAVSSLAGSRGELVLHFLGINTKSTGNSSGRTGTAARSHSSICRCICAQSAWQARSVLGCPGTDLLIGTFSFAKPSLLGGIHNLLIHDRGILPKAACK